MELALDVYIWTFKPSRLMLRIHDAQSLVA